MGWEEAHHDDRDKRGWRDNLNRRQQSALDHIDELIHAIPIHKHHVHFLVSQVQLRAPPSCSCDAPARPLVTRLEAQLARLSQVVAHRLSDLRELVARVLILVPLGASVIPVRIQSSVTIRRSFGAVLKPDRIRRPHALCSGTRMGLPCTLCHHRTALPAAFEPKSEV